VTTRTPFTSSPTSCRFLSFIINTVFPHMYRSTSYNKQQQKDEDRFIVQFNLFHYRYTCSPHLVHTVCDTHSSHTLSDSNLNLVSILRCPSPLANISSIYLVFIFRCFSPPINPVYVRRVDSSTLVFSLSSHRHSLVGLVFRSRFIDS
jgi:hypothetical protein